MSKKQYKIGGVVIQIESDFTFEISGEDSFRCQQDHADFQFQFVQVDDIPELLKGSRYIANVRWADVFEREDGSFIRAFRLDQYYLAVTMIEKGRGTCYYISEEMLDIRTRDGFEMFNFLCIEEILRQFEAVVLHSSHIRVGDKGMVFSAPSQTGKSTQAALWERYAGAQVLNGDRSVLRKVDGIWCVYGCPMSGTSGIHLQGDEPLSHVVMLAQSKENTLNRIRGRYAFMQLFPQITVPMWNQEETEHIMNLIEMLIEDVPVWYYSCTKEPEAVFFLKNHLFNYEESEEH